MDRTGQTVRLREGAVPTRFKAFPKHLKRVIKIRNPATKRSLQESSCPNEDLEVNIEVPSSSSSQIQPNAPSTPGVPSTLLAESGLVYPSPTKRKRIELEHSYVIKDSPRKIIKRSNQKIFDLKRKLNVSQQRVRRHRQKVKSLKTVIKHLKSEHKISSTCEEMLKETVSGVPLEIMQRITSGKKGKYPEELKKFALTLQFYSSKAYEYIRQTFDLSLPHQSQIRRWYSKIPAEPGFTEPAFKAMKEKAEEAKKNGGEIVCSLMLDEMAIKNQVFWDVHDQKYRGYVDLGYDVNDDSLPHAKDALVFMAVCVNASWKVPCAYFFY
ncbi:unnamed protein product [Meganyctiphanes norvegica]|uniref:Uncharacterized protein n=1 Tax=Meganyctiphanes norvegica TaxID=48144 RepID=A0AAV2RMW8_MEGNR